jgi:ABC-type bacteriocin/lantibiotic exporter with double-glycine peptidase domain
MLTGLVPEKQMSRTVRTYVYRSLLERPLITLSLLFTPVVLATLALLSSYLLKHVVDALTRVASSSHFVLPWIAGIAFAELFVVAISLLRQYFSARLDNTLSEDLIIAYVDSVVAMDLDEIESFEPGYIMSRMFDIGTVKTFLTSFCQVILSDLTLILVSSIVLFHYSWLVAMLACAPLPIAFFSSVKVSKRVLVAEHDIRRQLGQSSQHVGEALANFIAIKLFDVRGTIGHDLKRGMISTEHAILTKSYWYMKQTGITEMLLAVSVASVLLVGSLRVMHHSLSVGTFFLFYAMTRYFDSATRDIQALLTKVQNGWVAVNRLEEVLKERDEIVARRQAVNEPETLHPMTVVFHEVFLSYRGRPETLVNINLTIRSGEVVIITGQTGSGKTTLASLLTGLRRPTRGTITVNGIPLWDATFGKSIRKWFSMAPQESRFFTKSIRSNLVLGENEHVTDDVLLAALTAAEGASFVNALPYGLDSILGASGVQLSGGQKQRLVIARAIAKDSELVVLDEATSGLDAITERSVMKSLRAMYRDKILVIVTHRLHVVEETDRVIVLENGRLVEEGTPKELRAHNSLFATLERAQGKTSRLQDADESSIRQGMSVWP